MVRASLNRVFWRAYFKVYDRLNQAIPYQRLLKDGVNRLQVRPNGNYLDVGSGTGNSTLAIAERLGPGGWVLGIEVVPTAVSVAKTKSLGAETAKIAFMHVDINSGLRFQPAAFDGILANNVIYLVKDPVQTLVEVLRILQPGGRFVMTNPRRGGSPSKIFSRHLSLKKEEFRSAGWRYPTLRLIPHAAIKLLDFFALLPFQLALKRGRAIEARFWDAEEWQQVFAQVEERSPHPFEVSPPSLAYADQNYTFTLTRLDG